MADATYRIQSAPLCCPIGNRFNVIGMPLVPGRKPRQFAACAWFKHIVTVRADWGNGRMTTMAEQTVRFVDGDAYERGMGPWSRLAGQIFLDWLAPAASLRWIDVGCGTGAFTELIVQQCAPIETQGVDPHEVQ